MNPLRSILLLMPLLAALSLTGQQAPVKIAVIGLTHTHVHWILGRPDRGDIEIVGIVEPNRDLAQRYAAQHGYSMDLVYDSMEELVAATKPEAVTAFGTILDHMAVVEFFAPRGIHVMVEKPLAVSGQHAQRMAELARIHGIHLLTNYETTWYPTNHRAKALLDENRIGDLRKVIVRDGHRGPVNIGINSEFLDWLLDPKLNGGGALMDFGCYGANLLTWLMDGKRPTSVMAATQQLQPDNHPEVEDEATILLNYDDGVVANIQASWNWPIGRKDMELYGTTGALYADNRHQLRLRIAEGYDGFQQEVFDLPERPTPFDDPFALLAAVIRREHIIGPTDLSALENNLVVMEILDAARESARTGKAVRLD